jgi:plasmid stabilization system protein ParE
MSGYALTPLAQADIFEIWSYIADDSEDAANRIEQSIGEDSVLSLREANTSNAC